MHYYVYLFMNIIYNLIGLLVIGIYIYVLYINKLNYVQFCLVASKYVLILLYICAIIVSFLNKHFLCIQKYFIKLYIALTHLLDKLRLSIYSSIYWVIK